MGFMYNGIHSKNMKLKARLTSWQASPPLRNSYEIVPGKVGFLGSQRVDGKLILPEAIKVLQQKA
jgi:hypothetical protein